MSFHTGRTLVLCSLWLAAAAPFALADGPPPPAESGNLFSSDMSTMLGMTPKDPMGGMQMAGWHVMDMGVLRFQYNREGGKSGTEAFESTNWNMFHAEHDVAGGRFSLMLMNSLEPETMRRKGSPQLFQEGETLDRQPLIDVQHPHDFFMNLSATYRHPLGEEGGFWVQYAPVGEPALGPTAFMHRASSGDNPTAPLGHHGQDSTHITFGVVTAGFGWRFFAIEGSAFRGREPDENRWNFESGKLDSASGRLKFFLGDGVSAQISQGSIRNPEILFPGILHRTTASLHYGADGDRPVAVSLMWGRDRDAGRGQPSIALGAVPFAVRHPNAPRGYTDYFLLEGAWQINPRHQLYGRGEYLDRNFQLLYNKVNALPGQPVGTSIVRIKAVTLGYVRDFVLLGEIKTGVGGDITAYRFPYYLNGVYGGSPLSTHFFFRLRWGKPHAMDHMM